MRRSILYVCLSVFISYSSHCQDAEWSLISTIPVEELDQISMDNRENIFYSDKTGNVFKIDNRGVISNSYSPVLQARLTQLDAFSTLTLFLFSADLQQAVLLDTYLSPLSQHSFQQEDIGLIGAAALGNNNVFWLFDEVDLSLKLYDYRRNTVLQKQPLSLILGHDEIDVLEIQERQNLIFLNIKDQGILILDNQANLIKMLKVPSEQSLSLHKDHLYYIREGQVHRLNIFSEVETVIPTPETTAHNIIVSSNKIIFYSSNSLVVYDFPEFLL